MSVHTRLLGVVAATLTGVIGVVLLSVVPRFTRVYSTITTPDGVELELPFMTRSVIGLSDWMLDTKWFEVRFPGAVLLAICLMLLVAGAARTRITRGGRRFSHGDEPSADGAVRDSSGDRISIVAFVLIGIALVALPVIAYALLQPMVEIAESLR